jgi:uncharacterized protein
MKNTISFSTGNGNVYLYSPFRNQLLLCHPLIPLFYQADKESAALNQLIASNTKNKKFSFNGSATYPASEARIQLSRYRFLKKHGYFKPVESINLDGRLTPTKINENLSTIKQVIFETTEDCNLDCVYCIYSKFYINKERGKREFNFDQARRMLELILSLRSVEPGTDLIISFYGGEPLKNFKFIKQIVNFCQSPEYKQVNFRYTMSSNGLLLAKYAGFLAEHQMEVSISLDGDSRGNQFRVLKNNKSSYDLVIKNIDAVKEKYPDYFDKHITFLTVLHNQNSYGSVTSFFRERYNKIPLISAINTVNINEEFRDEFANTFLKDRRTDPSEREVMKEMFLGHPGVKEIADVIEKYSGFVFKNYYQVLSSASKRKQSKQFIPTATCLPFSMRVFLSADGSILPCEHISRVFEIGKFDSGEITITPETIAQLYNDYFAKIKELCSRCILADQCKECVFNTKIETDQPVCEFFTDEIRFTRGMASTLSMIEKDYPLYQRIVREAFHEK